MRSVGLKMLLRANKHFVQTHFGVFGVEMIIELEIGDLPLEAHSLYALIDVVLTSNSRY